MGYSNWSNERYASYADTTNLRSLSREQTFTSSKMPERFDPRKFDLRESRDSDFNPYSTPIIFGVDITGSMGYLSESIVKNSLPELMENLYANRPVTDPHVMFMGIGDVNATDSAPIQMSQFEADIRIVEQLRELYLEGGGGGNGSESYTMAWYAALHSTVTDAERRGERGFIFTIGDDNPAPEITRANITKVFGNRGKDMPDAGTNTELFAAVSRKFATFHIVAEDGSQVRYSHGAIQERWNQLIGVNTLLLRDHKYLPEVVTAAMMIERGGDIDEVFREVARTSKKTDRTAVNEILQRAFTYLLTA